MILVKPFLRSSPNKKMLQNKQIDKQTDQQEDLYVYSQNADGEVLLKLTTRQHLTPQPKPTKEIHAIM